jgi:PAS domain S-box-containing protein
MKIESRLSTYLKKFKGRQDNTAHWQRKFFSVLENRSYPVIEIYYNKVVYFNQAAALLFDLTESKKNYLFNDLFVEEKLLHQKDFCKGLFTLHAKNSGKPLSISIINHFSKDNYILEIKSYELTDMPALQIDDKGLNPLEVFQFCFSKMDNGFVMTDFQGNFLSANESFCSMTGFSMKELQTMFYTDITPAKWHPYEKKIMNDLVNENRSFVYKKELVHKNGYIFPVEIQIICYSHDRSSVKFVLIVRNMTHQKHTEDNLKKSDTTYRELFDSSINAIFVHDLETGKLTDVNQSVFDIYGYTKEEILETPFKAFSLGVSPYSQKEIKELLKRVKKEKQISFEWRDKRKNGELFWTQNNMKIASLYGKDHLIVTSSDITFEKKNREELLQTKKFLEAAIKQSPSAIIIADALDGKIRYSNFETLWVPQFFKRDFRNIKYFELRPSLNYLTLEGEKINYDDLPLERAISKGETISNCEFRVAFGNDVDIWVTANASPIKDATGKIIAGIIILSNISEKKHAELALQKSKLMLETILDTIPVRVFWKDKNLKYLGCNKRFLEDAGLSRIDQIINKTDYDLSWHDQAKNYQKDDKEVILSNLAKLNFEEILTTPKGEINWLKTSKIPLVNYKGETIGVLGTYEDINEQKKTQIELEKHRNHLELMVTERTVEIVRINKELQFVNEQLNHKNKELYDTNKQLVNEINERKNIEQKLKQSEETFRSFIEQSTEGICLVDNNGIIFEWNKSMSEIFETSRNKYIHKPAWQLEYDYLPAKIKTEETKANIQNTIDNYVNNTKNELFTAEYEREVNGKKKYIQSRVFPIQTSKGRIFGKITLDISEKKTTELELEKYKNHLEQLIEERTTALQRSDARVRLILHSVPMAFYSYNPENKAETIWYSEQIESLSGYKKKSFIKNPDLWVSKIHKEDYQKIGGLFNSMALNYHISCEYRWIDADDQTLWILDQAVLIQESENTSQQIIGCFFNITERKQAEKAIVESERNYREIFNSSSDAIIIKNGLTGKIEDVNDTLLTMYKCTYEEALSSEPGRFFQSIIPLDKKTALNHFKTAVENGMHRFECLAHRFDNQSFWADIIMKRIFLNEETKILSVIRDIDEKKHIEEQIRYRSNFEKLIFDISSRFINLSYNQVGRSLKIALEEICAFNKADAAYMFLYNETNNTTSIAHYWQKENIKLNPDQLKNVSYEITQWHTNQIKADKVIRVDSIKNLPKEADILKSVILQQNIQSFIDVPMNYQGITIGFFGLAMGKSNRVWIDDEIALLRVLGQTFVNAIKRKESIEALHESEQSHREIYNATTEAIITFDLETGRIIDVNKAMLDMFGYKYSEALDLNYKDLSILYGKYTVYNLNKLIKRAVKQGFQVFEWHAKKKNGNLFWVEVSLKYTEIKGVKRLLSVVRDITERKNAQETLRKNEEKYRLLIEGQTDLVVKTDTNNCFIFVSPSYCDLFGQSDEELIGKNVLSLVHEEDQETTVKAMEKLRKPPYTCYIEQRAFTKHGWRWIAWNNKAILDEKKQVKEIIGVGRDITYQKGVEDALKQSEDRFRSILQELSDIVFIIDEESTILYYTPTIKKILGYNEQYLIGKLVLDFIHPDDLEMSLEKMQTLINKSNQVLSSEIRLKHYDGRWIPIEATGINMLHHPSIKGLVITCRDISERKQVEKQILDAIIKTEERERERFAKNLHDDLGPLLSSIKMYVNSFSSSANVKKHNYIISQLNEVVREAIITTKEVSNDLSPHILQNYGLVSAIDSFLKKVQETIETIFESELITERFSSTIENSVYRIIKELLNNTINHADAKKIHIKLSENGYYLFLEYSDNGRGFDIADLHNIQIKGMGLSNIYSRAKSLNSSYDIQAYPNKGFSFQMKIPINQSME